MSSHTSEASVGIYYPCAAAGHRVVKVDCPEGTHTRSLRSLLRDDKRAVAVPPFVPDVAKSRDLLRTRDRPLSLSA